MKHKHAEGALLLPFVLIAFTLLGPILFQQENEASRKPRLQPRDRAEDQDDAWKPPTQREAEWWAMRSIELGDDSGSLARDLRSLKSRAITDRTIEWLAGRANAVAAGNRELADEIRGVPLPPPDETDPPEPPPDPPPVVPPIGDRWAFVEGVRALERRDVDGWRDLSGSYPGGGPHKFVERDDQAKANAATKGVAGALWDHEVIFSDGREQWISGSSPNFAIRYPLAFTDLHLGPNRSTGRGVKWCFRVYGTTEGMTIERVFASDFQDTTDAHFAYCSIAGGGYIFRDLYVRNIGGQVFQLRNDEDHHSGKLHVPTVGGDILIERVVIEDTGNLSRGAPPVTIWGVGRSGNDREYDVTLREVWIDNSWSVPGPKGERSRGSILVQNPERVNQEHTFGIVVLDRVYVNVENTDRDAYVNGAELVVFYRCHFQGTGKARVTIDRDDYYDEPIYGTQEPTTRAIFLDCTGDSPVWYGSKSQGGRGRQVGFVDEDFVVQQGERRDLTARDVRDVMAALENL